MLVAMVVVAIIVVHSQCISFHWSIHRSKETTTKTSKWCLIYFNNKIALTLLFYVPCRISTWKVEIYWEKLTTPKCKSHCRAYNKVNYTILFRKCNLLPWVLSFLMTGTFEFVFICIQCNIYISLWVLKTNLFCFGGKRRSCSKSGRGKNE